MTASATGLHKKVSLWYNEDEPKRAGPTPLHTLHATFTDDLPDRAFRWARRAELVLREGDPSLALEIVERLIGSAPGMSPGRVIAFLWKVKAEALAAVGQTEQAGILLRAAVENAQATGERSLLWPIHASLARLYSTTHHRTEAARQFAAAHQLIQELADTIPAPGLREGFLRRAHGMLEPVP